MKKTYIKGLLMLTNSCLQLLLLAPSHAKVCCSHSTFSFPSLN